MWVCIQAFPFTLKVEWNLFVLLMLLSLKVVSFLPLARLK